VAKSWRCGGDLTFAIWRITVGDANGIYMARHANKLARHIKTDEAELPIQSRSPER
jgi:hypothetical protein